MQTKPNIYNYKSFNTYFNDWVNYMKDFKSFSLYKMAQDLELSSITEISNILKGRRKVSHRVLDKLKNYMNLGPSEQYYLELIAELDRSIDTNPFIYNILMEKRGEFKAIF